MLVATEVALMRRGSIYSMFKQRIKFASHNSHGPGIFKEDGREEALKNNWRQDTETELKNKTIQ